MDRKMELKRLVSSPVWRDDTDRTVSRQESSCLESSPSSSSCSCRAADVEPAMDEPVAGWSVGNRRHVGHDDVTGSAGGELPANVRADDPTRPRDEILDAHSGVKSW